MVETTDRSETDQRTSGGKTLSRVLIVVGAIALGAMTSAVWGETPQWPPVLTWWIRWMVTIGMTSTIFAFSHSAPRWVLAAYLTNHAVAIGLGVSGLVPMSDGLINLTHVIFWTPAVVMLARGLGNLNRVSAYGVWHLLALTTMSISLVFDYRDAFKYLFF
jgi:hypothetical protein